MKLDQNTLNILKNYSLINPSIIIKNGSTLSAISSNKTVLSKAEVPNTFPKKFTIYDLTRFIGSISLMEDPDFSFTDKSVVITDTSGKKINYLYGDESSIKVHPPEKDIKLPSIDAEATLTETNIKEIFRGAASLALPEIAISGDGENVYLQAFNSKQPNGDSFKIVIGSTDKTFTAIFKYENLVKIMPSTYKVTICSQGISYFESDNIKYWVAVEAHSTF